MSGAAASTNGSSGSVMVPDGWMLAADLQKHYGGALRTIHRWGDAGRIGKVKDGQNRAWFDPADYARELGAELELEPGQVVQIEARKTEAVINGGNDLLKMLLKHQQEMHEPQSEATRAVLDLLREENKSLREQNANLQKAHLENMQAREELLSEAHARALEMQQFQAGEARKREALGMVKGPVKLLFARAMGAPETADTMPAPPSSLAPARALLASLTDDQVELLLSVPMVRESLADLVNTEVLSDEQKGFVREVLRGH